MLGDLQKRLEAVSHKNATSQSSTLGSDILQGLIVVQVIMIVTKVMRICPQKALFEHPVFVVNTI